MTTVTSLPTLQRVPASPSRSLRCPSLTCPPNPLGSGSPELVETTGPPRGCLFQAASVQEGWTVLCLTHSLLCLILFLLLRSRIQILRLIHPLQNTGILCLVDLVSSLLPVQAACIPSSVLRSSKAAVAPSSFHLAIYDSYVLSFASISYLVIRTAF